MKFLPTAFGQLAFAWKLYNYGLDGKIDVEQLDREVTFQEDTMVFVVPKALESDGDLIIALENNLTIAFGAAAITLNRVREEARINLPDPIATEGDACVALIYQIRKAFAHDIAEPRWKISRDRFKRSYSFGGLTVDLSQADGMPFEYTDRGGPDAMFFIKDWFEDQFL